MLRAWTQKRLITWGGSLVSRFLSRSALVDSGKRSKKHYTYVCIEEFVIARGAAKKCLLVEVLLYSLYITGNPCLQSNSQGSISLLRSVTVACDRDSSLTVDRSFQDHKSINDNPLNQKPEPKLRTFRGWKRNIGQLDKSRLSKSLWLSHVSIFLF